MDEDREYDECPICGSSYIEDDGYERTDVGRLVIKVKCRECYFSWYEYWDFLFSYEGI